MFKSSKTILLVVTILCTIFAAHGVTPDFSDYYGGVVVTEGNTIKLGFAVSNETKYLMEVNLFKRKSVTQMYMRIAPQSDSDEVEDAQLDCKETKKKIEEKHPDTISSKSFQADRRVIGIPSFGFGTLKKEGKESVPCYYFVVEYDDDYSDYKGGSIVCQDGNSIRLADGRVTWRIPHDHTFKVQLLNGKHIRDTFVRIAPLSNFDEVVTTIGDWENTKLEIENPTTIPNNATRSEMDKRPLDIISDGNGILKKNGKDDVSCYYFMVAYDINGVYSKNSKK